MGKELEFFMLSSIHSPFMTLNGLTFLSFQTKVSKIANCIRFLERVHKIIQTATLNLELQTSCLCCTRCKCISITPIKS